LAFDLLIVSRVKKRCELHQQFCGSGLRNRSNVTSAASAAQVPASSAQANPVKNVVDCLDTVIAVSTDHHWL
jgi:hypothetical protein